MLYIVSTPIGNLKDITLRALEVLRSVDLIAAEDTRHTRILLDAYGITTPLTSFFEHNEDRKSFGIVKLLKEGKSVALVTDAGTPGISDPGFPLICLARAEKVPLTVIPGPAAFLAALSLSGLPSDRFTFKGFLPVKSGARRKALQASTAAEGTIIFYESPHRILKCLKDVEEVLGDQPIVVVREVTKKFEECLEGNASQLTEHFASKPPRGEFVLLIPQRKQNSQVSGQ
jgi:16S rRNA (cytidine1402-2'-O)-methyltransferase